MSLPAGLERSIGLLDPARRPPAAHLGRRGLVVGLDASPTMPTRGRGHARIAQRGAYVRGDAIRLPFRDGAFDAICCFAALHFFDEPLAASSAPSVDSVGLRPTQSTVGPREGRRRTPA